MESTGKVPGGKPGARERNTRVRSDKAGGFTLLELVLVVVVIAVLAAVLVPAYVDARKASQRAACCSNMRELSRSVLMHAGDNRGCIVAALRDTPDVAGVRGITWRSAISDYVSNPGTFACPSAPRGSLPWGMPHVSNGIGDCLSTYGINACVAGQSTAMAADSEKKLDRQANPSSVILLIETKGGLSRPHWRMLTADDGLLRKSFPCYHNGRINVTFLDGHSRTMYLKDTLSVDPALFLWDTVSPDDVEWRQQVRALIRHWPADYPPNRPR